MVAMRRAVIEDIAKQRIDRLMKMAEELSLKDIDLADRYAELAFRIAMRAKVRLPKKYKLRICRKCRKYLLPGITASIRIRSRRETHIVVKCLRCGYIRRYVIRKKRSQP